ncbi:hypothetical protein [Nonomuraea rhizosphaerae]|uniref:hypothetical protein n=1 Tax=Nonomuraea rhizosphaerae TaxID=2665663 RepID=UPI001C5CF1F6|nr:hypothetical protein [Nonomuraea rhizosphaerae]
MPAGDATPGNGTAPENALRQTGGATPEAAVAWPSPMPSPQAGSPAAVPRAAVSPPPSHDGVPRLVPARTAPVREQSTTPSGPSDRSRAPRNVPPAALTPAPRTLAPPRAEGHGREDGRGNGHVDGHGHGRGPTEGRGPVDGRGPADRHEPGGGQPGVRLGADPCATFSDFRRDYCRVLLDRIARG